MKHVHIVLSVMVLITFGGLQIGDFLRGEQEFPGLFAGIISILTAATLLFAVLSSKEDQE